MKNYEEYLNSMNENVNNITIDSNNSNEHFYYDSLVQDKPVNKHSYLDQITGNYEDQTVFYQTRLNDKNSKINNINSQISSNNTKISDDIAYDWDGYPSYDESGNIIRKDTSGLKNENASLSAMNAKLFYESYWIPAGMLDFKVIKSISEIENRDPDETAIPVKIEAESLQKDIQEIMPNIREAATKNKYGVEVVLGDNKNFKYEDYKKSLNYHIGDAPTKYADYDGKMGKGDYISKTSGGHEQMESISAELAYNDLIKGQYREKV